MSPQKNVVNISMQCTESCFSWCAYFRNGEAIKGLFIEWCGVMYECKQRTAECGVLIDHMLNSAVVVALFQAVNRGCVFVTHIFIIITYLFVKKNQAYTCVLGLTHPSIFENVLYRGNQAVKIIVPSLLSEKSGLENLTWMNTFATNCMTLDKSLCLCRD